MHREFRDFEEFFPYYVGEHSRAATRWFHFAGTNVGIASFATGVALRRRSLMAAAPAVAYGMAWFSHFAIQKNRPATFGHPLWSLRGDARMLAMMWRGRDDELQSIAEDSRRITIAA